MALLVAAIPLTSACQPERVTDPRLDTGSPRLERGSEQPYALEEIARGMAMALGDSALRVSFKERLRKSRYVEHKIMLGDIVAELEGSDTALESAVSRSLGHPRGQLRRLVSLLPAIEVYMPLRRQRMRWTGQDEVIVAAAFSERAMPVAYTSKGEQVALSLDVPPEVPVIVLTARETLPGDTLPASLVDKAVADVDALPVTQCLDMSTSGAEGAAPAYYEPPVCDGGWTPPPPPQWPNGAIAPLPARSGIYLQAARIYDNHEPWIRGDPELEFSVELQHAAPVQRSLDNFEQLVPVPGIKMVTTQCSGLHSPDPLRRLNFNGLFTDFRGLGPTR